MNANNWIKPNWNVSKKIGCISTTRVGGFSVGDYAELNLGMHVEDSEDSVIKNRKFLADNIQLPTQPTWLDQQQGSNVINLSSPNYNSIQADAAYALNGNSVCAVLTADCLPVLFCDTDEKCVAAAHAGWRGLYKGILENTINALPVDSKNLKCWLGPAIGKLKFEVGSEVRQQFLQKNVKHENAFTHIAEDKYLADIYMIARNILSYNRVEEIFGGGYCTYSDKQRFYSYRRDGITGRMATLIWLNP